MADERPRRQWDVREEFRYRIVVDLTIKGHGEHVYGASDVKLVPDQGPLNDEEHACGLINASLHLEEVAGENFPAILASVARPRRSWDDPPEEDAGP